MRDDFGDRFFGAVWRDDFGDRFFGPVWRAQISAASKVKGAVSLTALLVGKQWEGGGFLEGFGGVVSPIWRGC